MTTATRHRYAFPNRLAAEQACQASSAQCVALHRFAQSLLEGLVQWTKARLPYRIGIFDQQAASGPKLALVFRPDGQRPSVDIYEAEKFLQLAYTKANAYDDDDNRSLLECLDEASAILRANG